MLPPLKSLLDTKETNRNVLTSAESRSSFNIVKQGKRRVLIPPLGHPWCVFLQFELPPCLWTVLVEAMSLSYEWGNRQLAGWIILRCSQIIYPLSCYVLKASFFLSSTDHKFFEGRDQTLTLYPQCLSDSCHVAIYALYHGHSFIHSNVNIYQRRKLS